MITETIHKNADNTISVELRSNGAAITDLASASKVTLELGGLTLSSATATAGAFDFTSYGAVGRLDMKLGHEAAVKTLKNGQYKATLRVFDTTYPNGRVWDDLIIEVR
jgi:hypothetical protein